MFAWLKKRLTHWVEELQRREIARLVEENRRLTEEIERQTGQPIQLTQDERRRLAKLAKGIDPERLRQISSFDPDESMTVDEDTAPTEDR